MKAKDAKRKWMWWLLAVVVAVQLYFVRELLAAFALFTLGFAFVAALLGSLYLLQKGWEAGVTRVAESQNPYILAARRGVAAVEEYSRRPLRRPNSQPAR